MDLLSTYCVQGIELGSTPSVRDDHFYRWTETACSVSFVQRGRGSIITGCTESREDLWQHSSWGWRMTQRNRDQLHDIATCIPEWDSWNTHPSLIWEKGWDSGMSGGQAAASVRASRPRRPEEGPHSRVPFSCGSSAISGDSVSAPASALQEERTRPKPSAFPFPWKSRLASYFSSLKIFLYHLNQGRQWTQGYRQGQRYKPTSHLGQTEKRIFTALKIFHYYFHLWVKSYCFHNLSKILNES